MQVIFIHGPPASGKYTIGARLSELTGLPLFHNHLAVDTAKCLFDFGTPSFNKLRATIWRAVFQEAASQQRSFIFTFNPEATVDPLLIDELCQCIRELGGMVHFVELICARETLLQRLGNASRAGFGKLVDPALFQLIETRNGFDFPPLPAPLLQIDTGVYSAEEAAQQIARAFWSQLN